MPEFSLIPEELLPGDSRSRDAYLPRAGVFAALDSDTRLARIAPDQGRSRISERRLTCAAAHSIVATYLPDRDDTWGGVDLCGPGTPGLPEGIWQIDLQPDACAVKEAERRVMQDPSVVEIRTGETHWRLLSARSSTGSLLPAVEKSQVTMQ